MNKSAERTINVLDFFAQAKRPLTLGEIGKHLELPKSSCFDLVYTLVQCGALEVDNEVLKTYRLGTKMFSIGAAVLDRNDLVTVSRNIMTSLASTINETVYLAVRDKNEIVYVEKVECNEPIRSTMTVGSRNTLHASGLGKAILAACEDPESELSVPLKQYTPHTICELPALLADLESTRRRGYAIDDREDMEFIKCVAAPILNRSGTVIAALSVSGLDVRMNDEKTARAGELVKSAALDISRRMGYTGVELFNYLF